MSGCRIEIRFPGKHLVLYARSKRTFRAPLSSTRALKVSSGDLVVRDSYLARKSIVASNAPLHEDTKRDTFGDGYRQISLTWGMRQLL